MSFRLHFVGVVDSTSELAFERLAAGEAAHGDVFVAEAQTRGRGRLGRSWESAPGDGLYASAVLAPGPPALDPVALTMAGGLVVLDAVREAGLETARLDWPNDVVVRDAKLAGILVESRGLDPADPRYVVGLGVNVGQRSFSSELTAERAVTSLALEGVETTPRDLAPIVAHHLERHASRVREAPEELASDYLAATGLAGALVRVETGTETTAGRLARLTVGNGLELDTGSGAPSTFRLEHVRALSRVETGE